MASTIKGITVEINGNTTGLTEALKGVDKQINSTQKELKQVKQALKFDPKNTELLAQKQKLLADSIQKTSDKLKTLKQAQEQAQAKGMDLNDEGYRELEREISKTTQALKGLETQQKNVNNAIKGASYTKIGEDFSKFGNACDKLANKLKGVSAIGALVSGTLIKISKDASANADELLTMSKQYGISVQKLQQYKSAQELVDVSLETMVKSHVKLEKAMASSSKETVKVFKELGVAVKDSNGEFRDSEDVFNDAIIALGKVENETQADIYANALFGKSFAELNPLIRGGAEELEKWNKYLDENNLLLSDTQIEDLGHLDDALESFKGTVSQVSQTIASDLAPTMTEFLNKLTELVLELKDKWDSLSDGVKKATLIFSSITAFLSPILFVLKKIIEPIAQIIQYIGTNGGLAEALGSLASPLAIVTAFLALIYPFSEEMRTSINDLIGSLKDRLQPIMEKIFDLLKNAFEFIITFIKPEAEVIGSYLGIVIEYINGLLNICLTFIESVLMVLTEIFGTLTEQLEAIYGWLDQVGVIDAFKNAFERVRDIIKSIVEWCKEAVDWIGKLINKVKEFFSNPIEKIGGLFNFGGGDNLNAQVSGFQSGALGNITSNTRNLKVYNTFQITKANITQDDIKGYGLTIAEIINEKLGEAM